MVRDRGRHVAAAVPEQARAEAPVDVLHLGEEGLVEQADLLEGGAPVERGAAAGAEHLGGLVVLPAVALAAAARPHDARPAQHVAGAVEDLAVVEDEHLRRRRGGRGLAVERRHELAEEGRVELHVVVDERDVLAARPLDAPVHAGREPDVARERDDLAPTASARARARPCRRTSRCRRRASRSRGSPGARATASRASSSARPFQVGITTRHARVRRSPPCATSTPRDGAAGGTCPGRLARHAPRTQRRRSSTRTGRLAGGRPASDRLTWPARTASRTSDGIDEAGGLRLGERLLPELAMRVGVALPRLGRERRCSAGAGSRPARSARGGSRRGAGSRRSPRRGTMHMSNRRSV